MPSPSRSFWSSFAGKTHPGSKAPRSAAATTATNGKVWVEVLMSEQTAEALARVLARAEAFDENEADAVLSLRKALRLGDIAGA
jgi:hypothetical protein